MRTSFLRFWVAASAATLAAPLDAAPLFALTNANELLRVDDLAPGTVVSTVAVTGLQPGETLVGIDFRPANEALYGLGNSNRLYVVDPRTGVATVVTGADGTTGGPLAPALAGASFGFDFNPTVDRIRVTSDAEQNLRLNPSDGVTATAVDANLAYAPGDPNVGQNPGVAAGAYTNSFNGATSTTLFGIDTAQDVLVTQNPPNNGTLNTVGALGVDAGPIAGFDIAHNGPARAMLTVGGVRRLYLVDLVTGTVLDLGAFSQPVVAIAIPPQGYSASLAGASATFTGSASSQSIRFDSSGGLLRHDRFGAGDAGFSSDFDFDSGVPGDQTLPATGSATINVATGGGDDTIAIGSAAAPAGGLGAISFVVDGGGGHDVVRIDDAASTGARSYVLGPSAIAGIFGGVAASAVESVEIAAGSGADGFSIGSTVAATTLRGGGGDDTFVIANGGGVNGGLVDGEAGNDTLDLSASTTDVMFEGTPSRELYLARASGAQEPGPLSSSPASGHVTATLSPDATALAFRVPYRDLAGASISGAHFHNAKAGINGGIERGLAGAELGGSAVPAGTFAGSWGSGDAEPLGATELAQLRANRIYLNLHTAPNFPSGEIRGQLIAQGLVGLATGTGGVRGVEVLDVTLFGDGFE